MNLTRITAKLNAPHPAHFDGVGVMRNAVISALVVFLLLYSFQPFGISEIPKDLTLWVSLGFGGVTLLVIVLLGYGLPRMWPTLFNEDRWNMKHNLIYTILLVLLIGFANLGYMNILGFGFSNFWQALWVMELYTFGIAIFPITFLTLIEQNQQLKKHAQKAERMNAVVRQNAVSYSDPAVGNLFVFRNEQGKPELQIQSDKLLFIRADGNYLDVCFDDGRGKREKHVLRNRLSKVCEELNHPDVFHCHRSYAVNLSRVVRIEGNARGYSLQLDVDGLSVPVSRNKNEDLFERFSDSR